MARLVDDFPSLLRLSDFQEWLRRNVVCCLVHSVQVVSVPAVGPVSGPFGLFGTRDVGERVSARCLPVLARVVALVATCVEDSQGRTKTLVLSR